ncbi:MFS transporter [Arthrobacter agilis]|uniref:MFS transporter n=1 Tax=Arthrobacter agilis TaxID=37921 RepID=UPI000B35D0A4|nr:MFS transporter [Arthrobacter agilis]OUM44825.1 MFS transporter [Arthrobacter agilis]PPB47149.1 MFS transporter [Arthrobacter agilis]TPV22563.1 MFS transporter [Arthrobacter agilis]VDR32388.1 Metal-tetracycline/H(+) antiporter [Arthrobacter agilis]
MAGTPRARRPFLPGVPRLPRRTPPGADPAPVREPIPREIRVLIAAAFVIAIGFGLVAPILPQFAQSFDVGVTASAVIVSAFAFTRLVFAPAGGRLVERLGERPVYIVGLLIVALSTAACAFAGDYWQLLVFRALGGIGSTMFTVSAMGLIVRLAPPAIRGRVSGAYATAFLLGSIGGPIVGGLLARFGLRVPFLVYAVALLIASAVVFFQLKDTSLADRRAARAKPPLTVREAVRDSGYRASLASSFANGWSSFGVRMALVPLFADVVLGAGTEIAGISLAFFAGGTALALTASGRLADSLGRRPLVITGLIVNGAAMVALGFSGNVVVFLALCVVAGVGTGLLNPAQQAAVADVIGNDRSGGKVLATFQMSSDFGAILGPVLAGLIIDQLPFGSFALAFAATGVLTGLAALVWATSRETLPAPAGTTR